MSVMACSQSSPDVRLCVDFVLEIFHGWGKIISNHFKALASMFGGLAKSSDPTLSSFLLPDGQFH
jgi:hypothetical protein